MASFFSRSLFLLSAFSACIFISNAKLHASCKIEWEWKVNCTTVNEMIVSQIKAWNGPKGCDKGGEKCLYTVEGLEVNRCLQKVSFRIMQLTESSPTLVKAVHVTPKHHYKDDLTFSFSKTEGGCAVEGYSTSELWYAILDYGTNYCNLHNLITGSKLDKTAGYKETTSDSICTQYSSHNCDKY